MKEVTVLIVDDHPLFREGIRNVLDSEKDIEVVAETTNGDEGVGARPRSAPYGCLN